MLVPAGVHVSYYREKAEVGPVHKKQSGGSKTVHDVQVYTQRGWRKKGSD
jgi:hypothetical protein